MITQEFVNMTDIKKRYNHINKVKEQKIMSVYLSDTKDIVADMRLINENYPEQDIRKLFQRYLSLKYKLSSTQYIIDYYVNKKDISEISRIYNIGTAAIYNALKKIRLFIQRHITSEIADDDPFEGFKFPHDYGMLTQQTLENIIISYRLWEDVNTFVYRHHLLFTESDSEELLIKLTYYVVEQGNKFFTQNKAEILTKRVEEVEKDIECKTLEDSTDSE